MRSLCSLAWIWIVLCGCELVATFDRSKVPRPPLVPDAAMMVELSPATTAGDAGSGAGAGGGGGVSAASTAGSFEPDAAIAPPAAARLDAGMDAGLMDAASPSPSPVPADASPPFYDADADTDTD